MRGFLYAVSGFILMALAYWAYSENYKTQDALRLASKLQREIGTQRETLSILEAEWAYLNRPERLRDLASMNFDSLKLLPITPDHFGRGDQVIFPETQTMIDQIKGAVDVTGVRQ